MSKIRKLLYILLIAFIILMFNSSIVSAYNEKFPTTLEEFSNRKNATLMDDDFMRDAIKKIGYVFPKGKYYQGFKNKNASSHGLCLNENSGSILSKGNSDSRMLLAIIDIAPNIVENPTGENAKKAIGYSYQAKGKAAYQKTDSDKNYAAISYLCYLASYYYGGTNNDIILTKANKFAVANNYAGKVWTQHAWWHGYKNGFARAIKKVMTKIAGNAFESSNSRSYKDGNQIDYVVYNAAMEYADFCDNLKGNKGIAIGSDQKEIDKTKKNNNGIVVGPIKLNHLVIDNTAKGKTNAEGGVAEGYVWKGNGQTLNIGEGTKNKIIVTVTLKNGDKKKFTYNVLNKETSGDIPEIKVSTDLNGSNEKNLDKMPVGKNFYLYIKDKNIKYGDIESIEIEDSYQLYRGRMYLFDSCGSNGEDQTVACGDIGISAGNEKYTNNKVKFDIKTNFDLSLRQEIAKINGKDINEKRGLDVKDIAKLKTETTAEYDSKGKAKEVKVGDKVIYTIRVYNEGIVDGYATQITEYVPEGLKFVENSQINKKYGWDWKDKKTTNINGITYKIYVTNYLQDKKINAYVEGEDKLSSQEIQIELEVDKIGGGEIHNIASITGQKDVEGSTRDRDSETNIISGDYDFKPENSTYQEDDDDYETILKLIDIGGIVFLDGHQTKASANEINGIYEPDAGEKPIKGIKVELYNSSSNKILKETTTDTNGHYKFENLSSKDSYYVKFYYNGVEYKVTEKTHGKVAESRDNDSYEISEERNALNAKFSEISYEFTKTSEYNNRTISARTDDYKGSDSTEIFNNLNLGIYVRAKADLSLINDVLETNIEVNGKKQTYKYNSIQTAEAKVREDDLTYSQNVYKADVEKGKDSFRFFVTYRIKVINESNVATSLKEIVDYYDEKYEFNNVLVKTSKGEKINAEKHDETTYKRIINDDKINNINKQSGYKALYIDLIDNKEIGNSEEVWIDITYELKDAAKVLAEELAKEEKTKARNYAEIKGFRTNEGVLEIDSTPGTYDIKNYEKTSEDDNGKTPVFMYKEATERSLSGNVWEAISSEIKQGADLYDNDKILTYVKENGIKGIKVELVELCQDGSQRIENTAETDENGAYEFKGYIPGDYVVRFTYGTDKNVQGKTTYDYNGKTYNAVINGQNYQSTKANPNINNTKYWYDDNKETKYSDAYDDAKMRVEQLNSFTEFGYDEASKLLEQDSNDYQNTEMMAYTGKLELEVEYATPITQYDSTKTPEYNVINVDLGLTPRTEADIQINKTIKHIKITLNNGIVHIDADIEDIANGKVKDAQYLKNSGVNLQLEDEIIQGATLEIEYNINVKNATKKEIIKIFKAEDGTISAVTYYGENIDKHPAYEGKDGENDKLLVLNDTSSYTVLNKKSEENREPEIKVLKLFDYSLNLNEDIEKQEKEIWKVAENAKHKGRDQEGNEQTFDIPNCLELINGFTLKSGEYKDFGIKSSTIISPSVGTDIDLNYVNNILISRLSTNTARIKDLTKLDVKSEETIITDPTGQMVIYYIIGGVSIVIFAVGTVLIKKYALKKKEE